MVPDENVSGVSLKPLLIMLVMMVASGQIAQTIFVPALPMMGEQFSVSAGQLQAIMGTYLLAYGYCNLFMARYRTDSVANRCCSSVLVFSS